MKWLALAVAVWLVLNYVARREQRKQHPPRPRMDQEFW